MQKISNAVRRVLGDGRDRGAAAVEYALIAVLIAAVIATTVMGLGTAVVGLFSAGLKAFP